MKNESESLEALQDIRKMMKESSRFLSLSGLSGILAGLYALAGAAVAHIIIKDYGLAAQGATDSTGWGLLLYRLGLIAAAVLVLAVATAFFLSARKARVSGHRLFDHTSRKLIWSMALPLLAGGIFCISLLIHGGSELLLISPAMLIFYGLALIASSRYTIEELRTMGYAQLALGLAASLFREYGLLMWALGFGVLHLIYGSIMWYKYDRR